MSIFLIISLVGSKKKERTNANIQHEIMIAETALFTAVVQCMEDGVMEKIKVCPVGSGASIHVYLRIRIFLGPP